MKKLFYVIVSVVILSLVFTTCKKEDENFYGDKTVYIAGQFDGAAVLWKNDEAQVLASNGGATSIFMSGNDIYVVGWVTENEYSGSRALWKNGIAQELPQGDDIRINDIFVSGNDVYIVGSIENGHIPTLWKNGISQILIDDECDPYSNIIAATGIYVSDNDIYVVGVFNDHYRSVLILWRNGVMEYLDIYDYYDASIYVSDNDVYIATEGSLWKNKVAQTLPNCSMIHDVFVSGNNVYVAGEQDDEFKPVIWKNGVVQSLPKKYGAITHAVFVSGSDEYVVGGGSSFATIWKNGKEHPLHDYKNGSNAAYSVFVK